MNIQSDDNAPDSPVTLVTRHENLGNRLDRFLADQCPGVSRARLQLLIRNHQVTVDGRVAKASSVLRAGQTVVARLDRLSELKPASVMAENIPLDVLFADDDIVAINKPPGMVVHPAKGHWSGTLTAALMFHFGSLSSVGGAQRPGIVHRLDRDTSGVIIVARNDMAHTSLMKQFEKRTVDKNYLAVVAPPPDRDRDEINAAIGPHPWQREKMAIRSDHAKSKSARTFYEVIERRGRCAMVRVLPKTGRTHQIRVHLASIGCPVLADRLYSGRGRITNDWIRQGTDQGDVLIDRQALHAESISFRHPRSADRLTFTAPLPADLEKLWHAIIDAESSGRNLH